MTPDFLPQPLADHPNVVGTDDEFQSVVETLKGVLHHQLHQTGRLVGLLRRRIDSNASGELQEYQTCLEVEKEVAALLVLVDRERVATITELGLLLGHRSPSRLRLAELVLYLRPEDRDELLELREELRDLADEIDELHSIGGQLERRVHDRITLFVAPDRAAPLWEPKPPGNHADDDPHYAAPSNPWDDATGTTEESPHWEAGRRPDVYRDDEI